MSDYQKDLNRFLDELDLQKQDAEREEKARQLAELRGVTVEKLRAVHRDLERYLRKLGVKRRITEAELFDLALQHAQKKPEDSN